MARTGVGRVPARSGGRGGGYTREMGTISHFGVFSLVL